MIGVEKEIVNKVVEQVKEKSIKMPSLMSIDVLVLAPLIIVPINDLV